MKAPETVAFAFDPDKSDIPALANRIGRILWACIRSGHIVDQYFNDQVLDMAEWIDKDKPSNYETFVKMINMSHLNRFGTRPYGEDGKECRGYRTDPEFWRGVWEYINGEKTLSIIIQVKK
jgi:hypothetical protein